MTRVSKSVEAKSRISLSSTWLIPVNYREHDLRIIFLFIQYSNFISGDFYDIRIGRKIAALSTIGFVNDKVILPCFSFIETNPQRKIVSLYGVGRITERNDIFALPGSNGKNAALANGIRKMMIKINCIPTVTTITADGNDPAS